MADFYVKYGSKDAKLIAYYKCGSLNLKLHKINDHKFVVSKNRMILLEHSDPGQILHYFHNAIWLENPGNDLFNN